MATWLFMLVFSLRRFINNRKDPYAFSILWFLITISLYSNTFMLIAATLGERFLFFPSAGFCLLLALLISKWIIKEEADNLTILKTPKLLAVLLPISVILVILTIHRNSEWTDNLTLYTADIQKAPRSVKLNYLLGMEYLNISKDEKDPMKQKKGMNNGINYLTRSLAIYPDYDDAQSELCDAYFRYGMYDSAAVHGRLSLALNPKNPYTLNNMGGIAFNRKDYQSTITQCEKAISIQPGVVDMYTNVAASFLSMGRSDSGIAWLYKAMAVDPDYPTTYRFLVMAYQAAGKPDSVKKYEAEEIRISAGR
jgi:tetratricopeptide (TPR) repeat protein